MLWAEPPPPPRLSRLRQYSLQLLGWFPLCRLSPALLPRTLGKDLHVVAAVLDLVHVGFGDHRPAKVLDQLDRDLLRTTDETLVGAARVKVADEVLRGADDKKHRQK